MVDHIDSYHQCKTQCKGLTYNIVMHRKVICYLCRKRLKEGTLALYIHSQRNTASAESNWLHDSCAKRIRNSKKHIISNDRTNRISGITNTALKKGERIICLKAGNLQAIDRGDRRPVIAVRINELKQLVNEPLEVKYLLIMRNKTISQFQFCAALQQLMKLKRTKQADDMIRSILFSVFTDPTLRWNKGRIKNIVKDFSKEN